VASSAGEFNGVDDEELLEAAKALEADDYQATPTPSSRPGGAPDVFTSPTGAQTTGDQQEVVTPVCRGSDPTSWLTASGRPCFDLEKGDSWIYPKNMSERKYQLDIVSRALFRNTLVSLPTGLGKTFIAAVVMFNFWRWYPGGKVCF
jgi:hypothetical protein